MIYDINSIYEELISLKNINDIVDITVNDLYISANFDIFSHDMRIIYNGIR
jgi:hypothetical protein